jgi:hypothetical protein
MAARHGRGWVEVTAVVSALVTLVAVVATAAGWFETTETPNRPSPTTAQLAPGPTTTLPPAYDFDRDGVPDVAVVGTEVVALPHTEERGAVETNVVPITVALIGVLGTLGSGFFAYRMQKATNADIEQRLHALEQQPKR